MLDEGLPQAELPAELDLNLPVLFLCRNARTESREDHHKGQERESARRGPGRYFI